MKRDGSEGCGDEKMNQKKKRRKKKERAERQMEICVCGWGARTEA